MPETLIARIDGVDDQEQQEMQVAGLRMPSGVLPDIKRPDEHQELIDDTKIAWDPTKDNREAQLEVISSASSKLRKTVRKIIQQQEEIAIDQLTGLYNKDYFELKVMSDRISYCADKGLPMTVLFLDLNKFKPVNDTYGHDAGDHALRVIGERISASIRSNDASTLHDKKSEPARMGGDEFVAVLNGTSKFEAQSVADRLSDIISEPITYCTNKTEEGQYDEKDQVKAEGKVETQNEEISQTEETHKLDIGVAIGIHQVSHEEVIEINKRIQALLQKIEENPNERRKIERQIRDIVKNQIIKKADAKMYQNKESCR